MTSSLSTATVAALSSELSKIAEAQFNEESRPTFKKWLKTTAVIGAGYGAGRGVAELGGHLLGKVLGPKFSNMGTDKQKMVLKTIIGLSAAGGAVAAQNMAYKKWKALNE